MKKCKKPVCLLLVLVLMVSFLSACSLFGDDTDDNGDGEALPSYDVEVARSSPNVVLSAKTAIEDGLHSSDVETSFYDESGNWYYIFYLGQIEDFIFQVHHNFEYTKAISDLMVEEKSLTSERVKTTYEKIVTNSTQKVITNEMSSSLDSSVKVKYGIFSAGVESNISAKYQDVWTGSLVEVTDNYVEHESVEVNEKTVKYYINGDYLTEGKWYCYATVATVDVYAAVVYRPEQNAITSCEYYTNVISYGGKKLFSSDRNDFMKTHGSFDFDLEQTIGEFTKPTEYVEIYKPVTEKYVHSNDNVKVAYSRFVNLEVPLTMYDECVAAGYNRIQVHYSFLYMKGTPVILTKAAKMYLYVGPTKTLYWEKVTNAVIDTGEEKTYDLTFSIGTSWIEQYKKLYFNFENKNAVNEYYVKLFNVEITYYHVEE